MPPPAAATRRSAGSSMPSGISTTPSSVGNGTSPSRPTPTVITVIPWRAASRAASSGSGLPVLLAPSVTTTIAPRAARAVCSRPSAPVMATPMAVPSSLSDTVIVCRRSTTEA